MHSARHLMLIDICIKYCEYSLSGFQVIERTRFVTDRQTDAQGKTICLPTRKGGDIITHPYLDACKTFSHHSLQLLSAFSSAYIL